MRNPTVLVPSSGFGKIPASKVNDSEWINPEPLPKYDLIVIGAGAAGRAVLESAISSGKRVAVIDRDSARHTNAPSLGECYREALLAASVSAAASRHGTRLGIKSKGGFEVNVEKALDRAKAVQSRMRGGAPVGFHFFAGEARFFDTSHLAVGQTVLEFSKAVICTGTRPLVPWISGAGSIFRLTGTTLPGMKHLPSTMAILGTGPAACEFAHAFARLGVSVSLIGRGPGVLEGEDSHAAILVKERMRRDGVKLLCCAKEARVEPGEFGGAIFELSSHGESHRFAVECVLDATEGIPDLENLALENAGIALVEGEMRVDNCFRTSNQAIFAIGSVCPAQGASDPVASADLLVRNALFGKRHEMDFSSLPRLIRTGPELARVGMQAEEAERLGQAVETLTHSFLRMSHAAYHRQTDGFIRIHILKSSGRILGATVVAPGAGEIIGALSLAIKAEIGIEMLASCPFAHPTFSEAIQRLSRGFRPSGGGGLFRRRSA